MYRLLGKLVARGWPFLIAAWMVLLGALWLWAPPWSQVGKSGQFAYLPDDAPSRRAEALFEQVFPGQRAASNVVLVVTRRDAGPLTADDLGAVEKVLAPRLQKALLPD